MYKAIVLTIIILDTLLLSLRALLRRVSLVGVSRILARARVPGHIPVLYLDLGTHKEGTELAWMVDRILPGICDSFEAYGFEASRESFAQVSKRFAGRNVSIVHKALCREVPSSGKVTLYKDSGRGSGDSLYRHSDSYEEVDATRLSDWLIERSIILQRGICLLRMNIEGAEYDVIEDLVETGLARNIDGYYGMWDDVFKIDQQRDEAFSAFLKANRIHPFTLNGRDMRWPWRRRWIQYDINTSVLASLYKFVE
jgi:FkbM family methyltransferase